MCLLWDSWLYFQIGRLESLFFFKCKIFLSKPRGTSLTIKNFYIYFRYFVLPKDVLFLFGLKLLEFWLNHEDTNKEALSKVLLKWRSGFSSKMKLHFSQPTRKHIFCVFLKLMRTERLLQKLDFIYSMLCHNYAVII